MASTLLVAPLFDVLWIFDGVIFHGILFDFKFLIQQKSSSSSSSSSKTYLIYLEFVLWVTFSTQVLESHVFSSSKIHHVFLNYFLEGLYCSHPRTYLSGNPWIHHTGVVSIFHLCSYFKQHSLVFSSTRATCIFVHMCSMLIISFLVTPHIHHSMPISASCPLLLISLLPNF